MNTGIGIIVASLIARTTYWAASSSVVFTAGAGGVFVINQEANKVAFCISTSTDRPACRTDAIIWKYTD